MCYIQTKPYAPSELPGFLFMIVPVSMSILAITCLTTSVVYYVFVTERQSCHTSARQEQLALTKKTLWQSLLFLCGFYVVWPVFFVSFLARPRLSNYWFYVLASLLCPSQGIFNALVYFRRRNTVSLSYLSRVVKINWKTRSTLRDSMDMSGKRRNSEDNYDDDDDDDDNCMIGATDDGEGSSNFFVMLRSFSKKAEKGDGSGSKHHTLSRSSSFGTSDDLTCFD
mmetsp:Transcript_22700/g.32501  ORF Transcript_22700/g.32501 Transcript_22700/m.32501 type:complete len:225 (-) Transcript_22700:61-735(-)